MPQTSVPLDIIYPVVSEVVVDCVDGLFITSQTPTLQDICNNPTPSAPIAFRSLMGTSVEIRRIALEVLANGLRVGLCKKGIWRLHTNPWRLIQFTPRITSGILARVFECLASELSLNRSLLRTFYTLYLTAKHSFTCTEKRFHAMTHITLEDGKTRMLDEPVNHAESMQHARQAEKQASLALASALRAAPAFRSRLVGHAVDLQVRVQGFIKLRLQANELFAKLHALVAACVAADVNMPNDCDPSDRLMSVEQALVQLKNSEMDLTHLTSQYAKSRPVDELVGSEVFATLCSVLRRATTADVLDSGDARAAAILADVAETRERCRTLSEEMLEMFETKRYAVELAEAKRAIGC
ncbi:uncharacterized protein PHACADRAFT_251067 [Phanerochaete carnosa HHB-10118-sp]|uniref:Uncharacterized protein n=1 Tax=Phanerochaete carnosa (strain HHB-10118-sp) TaxID=650164 RepID=K5X3N9_PHACS|nr:uncharacterized protein PHACADRAFT_251067 [Phanerochaete carnosa HHB-10118-sp]EKM57417.1 hypothetical protein PHACADRAFT_251067 [Phanerochaete carnosa HHB-10118-sp]